MKPAESASHRTQSLKSHSLAFTTDPEHGIRVPVTEIALEPSPGGVGNPPVPGLPHGRPGQRPGPRASSRSGRPGLRPGRTPNLRRPRTGAARRRQVGGAPRRGVGRVEGRPAGAAPRRRRQDRHADALRTGRGHHPGDAVRGAARELRCGTGPQRSGRGPRHHPQQRQPPANPSR